MAKVKPELFEALHDQKVTAVLTKLYKATLKQGLEMVWHFLPKAYQLFTKSGMDWKSENLSFYDDKYIPIHPAQGTFMYMQAIASRAQRIFEFGTSYGISTIYLAKAAQKTGGKVISTEYLPHKVRAARQNIDEAGLSAYVDVLEGDVRQTLSAVEGPFDLVLLDGFPDLVFEVFKLLEPKLAPNAVIMVDDVEGFGGAMQDYLAYVRDPANGYLSTTLRPKKGLEFTVKLP